MSSSRPTDAEAVLAALSRVRIAGSNERVCQDALEQALTAAGLEFRREEALGPADRIDFLVGDVGIEVKMQGSRGAIIRQLGRYAKHGEVRELILASSVRRILYSIPPEVLGKPVHPHLLQGRAPA
jgi:hypothetical protein